MTSFRRCFRFAVSAAVGLALVAAMALPAASSADEPYGLKTFSNRTTDTNEDPYTFAGGHPYQNTTEFSFPTVAGNFPVENLKGTYVTPPLGFIGNPAAATRCEIANLRVDGDNHDISDCPPGSALGVAACLDQRGGEKLLSRSTTWCPNVVIRRSSDS